MRKSSGDGIIKGNGLEAYWSIGINFSNGLSKSIVEGLEVKPLTIRRDQNEGVSDDIPRERFVNQFISNDIFVVSEPTSNFHPKISEFFVELMVRMIEIIEGLSNIIAEVISAPLS